MERMDFIVPNGQATTIPCHVAIGHALLVTLLLPNLILCSERGDGYSVHRTFHREYEYAGKWPFFLGGVGAAAVISSWL